jgi:hypothetical protein
MIGEPGRLLFVAFDGFAGGRRVGVIILGASTESESNGHESNESKRFHIFNSLLSSPDWRCERIRGMRRCDNDFFGLSEFDPANGVVFAGPGGLFCHVVRI